MASEVAKVLRECAARVIFDDEGYIELSVSQRDALADYIEALERERNLHGGERHPSEWGDRGAQLAAESRKAERAALKALGYPQGSGDDHGE